MSNSDEDKEKNLKTLTSLLMNSEEVSSVIVKNLHNYHNDDLLSDTLNRVEFVDRSGKTRVINATFGYFDVQKDDVVDRDRSFSLTLTTPQDNSDETISHETNKAIFEKDLFSDSNQYAEFQTWLGDSLLKFSVTC